ncbi:MAG: Fur family transcriptional regulator [Nocardioides sp.]
MTTAGRERTTRQFQAVLDELTRSQGFRSAQEIHAAMHQRDQPVGLATVYRALQSMVESGRADALRTSSGESLYRECSQTHHHHLVCRSCGRTVEIEGPAVERWADKMAREHGYVEVSHTLELFGTCPECTGAKPPSSDGDET